MIDIQGMTIVEVIEWLRETGLPQIEFTLKNKEGKALCFAVIAQGDEAAELQRILGDNEF